METSLHRELKHHFAANSESVEVTVDGYRIDAIDATGALVEIQHSGLGSIRKKALQLLANGHQLRIIKPSIGNKWIETSGHFSRTHSFHPSFSSSEFDP